MLEKITTKIIRVFAIIMLLYLFFLTIFTSSPLVSEGVSFFDSEVSIFEKTPVKMADMPWVHAAVIIGALFVLYHFRNRIGRLFEVIEKKRVFFYVLYALAGTIYILTINSHPISDPSKVLDIAYQIMHGDVTAYTQADGYMYRYPFQNSIVLLDIVLIKIFGNNAYLAFQFINLASQLVFVIFIGKYIKLVWGSNVVDTISKTLLFLFPAFFLYVTYNYGNLISLALIVVALYYEQRFINERHIKHIVISAVIAAIACLLKPNTRIMLVAMAICLLLDFFKHKRATSLMFIIALVAMRILVFSSVDSVMEMITGVDTPKGMPKLNWVCMGITNDGNYNGLSLNLFEEAEYDYDRSVELAKEYIIKRIDKLWGKKIEIVRCLGRKMALNWANPTFDVFSLSGTGDYIFFDRLYSSLFEGNMKEIVIKYLNIFQSLILFFSLMFCLTDEKLDSSKALMLLAVLGGFTFHIVWEASSHYVLPYFLMLFPYAASGIENVVKACTDRKYGIIKKMGIIVMLGCIIFALKNIRLVGLMFFAS